MKRFGTYTYTHKGYDGFVELTMRVEIIREKGSRSLLKYLGFHANGAKVGSLHWARTDKVTEDGIGAIVAAAIKNTPATKPVDSVMTKQDAIAALERIYRLPYKDNDNDV